MVAPHAEDRFYGPDYYFGKVSTDITKRSEIPSHAYNPRNKHAPTPYYVTPFHDMSDKFRNTFTNRGMRVKDPEDTYYGRRSTDITSPMKFSDEENETAIAPWPESSKHIGDMTFTRYEYLRPLGKTKPNPMDDYYPILRDRKTGRVINNPSQPPSREQSRRRLIGLPPVGCHSPGSPCRSRSPSDEADREDDDGEQVVEDDVGRRRSHPKKVCVEEDREAETSTTSARDQSDEREYSAPAEVPEKGRPPPRRKSYLTSTFGSLSTHVQPVGGRSQRNHSETMGENMYRNERPEDMNQRPDRPSFTLGSMNHRAQPVGGRASIINLMDMEQIQRDHHPRTEHLDVSTSYHESHRNSGGRVYPPQHHSFRQEQTPRARDVETFSRPQFHHRDEGEATSSHSVRRRSKPPQHDPNLPPERLRGRSPTPPTHDPNLQPEGERGRSHRRSVDQSASGNGGGGAGY